MSSLFLFKPAINQGLKDSFEWKTEVQRVYEGGEHRRQLREFPRRIVEFSVSLDKQDKQIFENWLAGYQAQVFYLPLWHEESFLTATAASGATTLLLDTTYSSFDAVGYALLFKNKFDYEIVPVVAKTASSLTLGVVLVGMWVANTRVYPLVFARLEESQRLSRFSSNVLQTPLKFLLENPASAFEVGSFAETYRGIPLLTVRNGWEREVTSEYNRQLEVIDFEIFGRFVDDESGLPTIFLDYHFLLKTAAERYGFIQQLYFLAGKWQVLWVASGQHDFTIAAPISAGSFSLTTVYTGLSEYGIFATKPALKITLKSGVFFCGHLIEAVNNGNNTETLTLDVPISSAVSIAEVLIISYLMPMRLTADLLVLEHIGDSVSQCSVSFQTVSGADEYLPLPQPTYEIVASNLSSVEGAAVTCVITTTDVADGTVLYYTVDNLGTITTADFSGVSINDMWVSGVTGFSYQVTINNNTATLIFYIKLDAITEVNATEIFTVSVRTGSISGTVVAVTPTINIGSARVSTPSSSGVSDSVLIGTDLYVVGAGSTTVIDTTTFTTSNYGGNYNSVTTDGLDLYLIAGQTLYKMVVLGTGSNWSRTLDVPSSRSAKLRYFDGALFIVADTNGAPYNCIFRYGLDGTLEATHTDSTPRYNTPPVKSGGWYWATGANSYLKRFNYELNNVTEYVLTAPTAFNSQFNSMASDGTYFYAVLNTGVGTPKFIRKFNNSGVGVADFSVDAVVSPDVVAFAAAFVLYLGDNKLLVVATTGTYKVISTLNGTAIKTSALDKATASGVQTYIGNLAYLLENNSNVKRIPIY